MELRESLFSFEHFPPRATAFCNVLMSTTSKLRIEGNFIPPPRSNLDTVMQLLTIYQLNRSEEIGHEPKWYLTSILIGMDVPYQYSFQLL